MSLIVEQRNDGTIAFSIDGDLQFDTRDEAVYHENLVLPALTIARRRGLSNLRVLICGGGDGLALREALRFPGVAAVDLVDLSAEVLELGRTRFAELNDRAFEDSRVTVHVQDAWSFLSQSAKYDVVVADFSIPHRTEDARVFTAEWYAMAKAALTPLGVLAVNAVSPQVTPAAFWCQVRSLRSIGLRAVPYRSCIPSFRERGYGAWGVILASRAPLSARSLRAIECPVTTRQADLGRLWKSTRFSRAERMLGHLVPVHRLDNPCFTALLLNGRLEPPEGEPWAALPPPLRRLFEALPVSHPYHTRLMVQTLAESVIGDLSRLRLRKLLDELIRRAARLPERIAAELARLRGSVSEWAGLQNWDAKVLAALILVLTLANTLAPDHAFAKGHASFGHASMARSGSFGRLGAFAHSGPVSAMSIHAGGFRSSPFGGTINGQHYVTDMEGDFHPTHVFYYSHFGGYGYGYGGYGYGYGGGAYDYGSGYNAASVGQARPPAAHTPVFAADDDLLVMDNGDLVVTLSPKAFLLVDNGHLELMGPSKAPLLSLALDANFAATVRRELNGRLQNAVADAKLRRDWLSWVNWTAAVLPGTRADQLEVKNLDALQTTLIEAGHKLGGAASSAVAKPDNATLAFQSCFLYDNAMQFRLADGRLANWDGSELTDQDGKKLGPTSPEFKDVMLGIFTKLASDLKADEQSTASDRAQIEQYEGQLRQWLQEYESYAANYGSNYTVDYGTDEVPAYQAIALTQADITQNAQDRADNIREATQNADDSRRVAQAIGWLK